MSEATRNRGGTAVLCGKLSLGSAIVAEEWAAHDLYGRNR
jgi:hypothetical protein